MDNTVLGKKVLYVDLESGRTASEEDRSKDTVLGVSQSKRLLGTAWNGSLGADDLAKCKKTISTCNSLLNSTEVSVEILESKVDKKLGGGEKVNLMEKGVKWEKPRKKSCKPPKPPRPPKSPVLDAADQKLIREITELAMLKRARNERMKALKKKAAKATASSGSNICAMVITILFCLIIILQGVFSRGSSNPNFQGSPESAVHLRGGLISVQYDRNALASSTNDPGPGSESPNTVEQVSGLDNRGEDGSRALE